MRFIYECGSYAGVYGKFCNLMVRFSVYVAWPSSCFEFEESPGPQSAQNKSSEKDFCTRKNYNSDNFCIPGLT